MADLMKIRKELLRARRMKRGSKARKTVSTKLNRLRSGFNAAHNARVVRKGWKYAEKHPYGR